MGMEKQYIITQSNPNHTPILSFILYNLTSDRQNLTYLQQSIHEVEPSRAKPSRAEPSRLFPFKEASKLLPRLGSCLPGPLHPIPSALFIPARRTWPPLAHCQRPVRRLLHAAWDS